VQLGIGDAVALTVSIQFQNDCHQTRIPNSGLATFQDLHFKAFYIDLDDRRDPAVQLLIQRVDCDFHGLS
jgi:hypothetical protein